MAEMKRKQGIAWTEDTWNPSTGCDRVSPGCDNCSALDLAERLKTMGNPKYQNDGEPPRSGPGFGFTLHQDSLDVPRRWQRPRFVFVNSMSDLFHEEMPMDFLQAVFTTMNETPRHTYQILTKRSQRLARLAPDLNWTPNIWMGVSVENQKYSFRARHLAETEGPALRFLSVEPLVGPVDNLPLDGIDWVIVGGESGHSARPMHPAWINSVIDQVLAAPHRPALFIKQWGSWIPTSMGTHLVAYDGTCEARAGRPIGELQPMLRTGRKNELPRIDHPSGLRVWDEMPPRVEPFREVLL